MKLTGSCANNRIWTEADRAELLKRRRAGQSSKEIGEAMGRTPQAVNCMAYKLEMPVKKRPHKLTELNQVRRLAERGYSDRVIGLTIGRSRTAVSQIRDRYKIPAGAKSRHKRWGYTSIDIDVVRHCYQTSKAPIRDAAKLLGRSRDGVQQFASKMGLTKRRKAA